MNNRGTLTWIAGLLSMALMGAAAMGQAPTLASIDEVVEQGPYKADWKTMSDYPVSDWYLDAKFGIFIHWGVYSVPAYGNEWYPRRMYIDEDNRRGNYFQHHLKTWGPHNKFGYKDFIPMFKAEKFDAGQWAELFQQAGARYVVPVAEHHDGFPMYPSSFTLWDAKDMGPRRDVIGELEKAVRGLGMHFGVSSHHAFNWVYYPRDDSFDTVHPENRRLYGKRHEYLYGPMKNPWPPQDESFKDAWLTRTCELVDNYKPELVWFDFGIGPKWVESPADNPFQSHLRKFTAYYYNRAKQWGQTAVINYKHKAMPEDVAVLDVERGKLSEIRQRYWQTDTSVSFSSWGYVTNHDYKNTNLLVDDLIDIVSKNGCLLLNIGPKPDGTIPEPEIRMLREIGQWLKLNGEAIYGTRPWVVFGEGPTEAVAGPMAERKAKGLTAQDIRFTTKGDTLYAIALGWPKQQLTIKALGTTQAAAGNIGSVALLGHAGELKWSRDENGLTIQLPDARPCEHAFAFKITR